MNHIKTFESFSKEISESYNVGTKKLIDRKLALITVKYLYKERPTYVVARTQYLSQEGRKAISTAYGNKLPRGFAGPETPMTIGDILGPALYDKPKWNQLPYYDDAELVFDSWPLVFKSRVENRQLTSTWSDLGDWLKVNYPTPDGFPLEKWLESNDDYETFLVKNKGFIGAKKLGLI
jgi:hypothetical protein